MKFNMDVLLKEGSVLFDYCYNRIMCKQHMKRKNKKVSRDITLKIKEKELQIITTYAKIFLRSVVLCFT